MSKRYFIYTEVSNKIKLGSDNMPNYNSLESIDKLIERLEPTLEGNVSTSPEMTRILKERQEKLERLKALKQQHALEEQEAEALSKLREDNDELDRAISSLEKMISKTRTSKERSCGPYYSGGMPSESRSSESRGPSFSFTPSYSYGESRSGESNW